MANITKRGDTYKITVSLGFDMNGKQRRKIATFKPPQGMTERQADKEAEKFAIEFEEKCKNGNAPDQTTRFHDFKEKFLTEYAEKQLKVRTYTRYREILARADDAFGTMRLKDIKPFHLQEFYNNLGELGVRKDIKQIPNEYAVELIHKSDLTQKDIASGAGISLSAIQSILHGKNVSAETAQKFSDYFKAEIDEAFDPCEDKPLSGRTIKDHHTILSSLFSVAVQWQVIPENPCSRVKPPKYKATERKYLDENGASALLAALSKEPYHYQIAVYILLYTGLRRGEVCGLEWSDLDFINNLLTVRHNLLYTPKTGLYVDEPKSESSKRVVTMPLDLVNLLKDNRKWQKEQSEKLRDAWNVNDNVVKMPDGNIMRPDTLSTWFHEFIKRNDLPDISLHSLRHTHATLLIASGIPLKSVSARLGHSSVAITGDLYSHAIQSVDAMAVGVINDILSPAKNAEKKIKIG